ncbi:MAG: hypothetical protein WC438_02880 [Candidatus Pacearchaeota archaeon]
MREKLVCHNGQGFVFVHCICGRKNMGLSDRCLNPRCGNNLRVRFLGDKTKIQKEELGKYVNAR